MRRHLLWVITASIWCVSLVPVEAQDASTRLIGTWKLVSAKFQGQESTLSTNATTLKHFTPTHFMWVTYDKAGKVTRTGGGPYSFNGKTLEETPAYGLGSDFDVVIAKRQAFDCKVEGKRLYQNGTLSNGTTLEEIWELVPVP